MATVFKRISYLCTKRKIPLLPQNRRNEIGKQVAALYREQNGEMPVKKVLIDEPEQKFFVQWYPTEFIPEIDRVIKEQLAIIGNNVQRFTLQTVPEPVEIKKRKRIPLKPQKVTYGTNQKY